MGNDVSTCQIPVEVDAWIDGAGRPTGSASAFRGGDTIASMAGGATATTTGSRDSEGHFAGASAIGGVAIGGVGIDGGTIASMAGGATVTTGSMGSEGRVAGASVVGGVGIGRAWKGDIWTGAGTTAGCVCTASAMPAGAVTIGPAPPVFEVFVSVAL